MPARPRCPAREPSWHSRPVTSRLKPRRFVHSSVEFPVRMSRQFGGLRFRDGSLGQGTRAAALEPHGRFGRYLARLAVRRTAPSTTGAFLDDKPIVGDAADPEVIAAASESLHAHAKMCLSSKGSPHLIDRRHLPISARSVPAGARIRGTGQGDYRGMSRSTAGRPRISATGSRRQTSLEKGQMPHPRRASRNPRKGELRSSSPDTCPLIRRLGAIPRDQRTGGGLTRRPRRCGILPPSPGPSAEARRVSGGRTCATRALSPSARARAAGPEPRDAHWCASGTPPAGGKHSGFP